MQYPLDSGNGNFTQQLSYGGIMSKKTQENMAGLSRRSFIKGAGTLAAASMFGGVAPYVMSNENW